MYEVQGGASAVRSEHVHRTVSGGCIHIHDSASGAESLQAAHQERITLDPTDITVVDVFPTQEMNQFVAVGLLAGETDLEVRNEAGVVSEVKLRVEVVPQ